MNNLFDGLDIQKSEEDACLTCGALIEFGIPTIGCNDPSGCLAMREGSLEPDPEDVEVAELEF